MNFTREQFDEYFSDFVLNDMCIDLSNDEHKFNLFNLLPGSIQGIAVSWGVSDTDFNDQVFTWLCEKLFKCSTQDYYNLELTKIFFNSDEFKGINPEYIIINNRRVSNNEECVCEYSLCG